MNKRVTYWTLPVENYKERLLQLELLPILYYQELKELFIFNISNKYNVDFPNMKSNTQIEEARVSNYQACAAKPSENFWYRACYRANQIMEFLNPDIQISIEAQILQIMCNNFINTFNEQNLCSHCFICICLSCRSSRHY